MNIENMITYGEPLERASTAVILVHGRGASAQSLLPLARVLDGPGIAFLLPQAPGGVWYPYPFMSPIEQNEPQLSAALNHLGEVLALAEQAGITAEHVVLGGFSQGACLASEFAARNTRRYQGIAALSGGLIGPFGTPRDYPGSLLGTPTFVGCGVPDAHIPKERVLETAQVLEQLGALVTTRLYPGMDHIINDEEIGYVQQLIRGSGSFGG